MRRLTCIVVALAVLACSRLPIGARDADRPIPAEPMPLFADGTAPAGAAGGAYDGAGRVIFDVFPGGQGPATAHVSTYGAVGWSAPVPALTGFGAWHAGAQVSPDGRRLYFESVRRDPPVMDREDTDLWVAERSGDAWVGARPLGPPFDSPHNEHGVTVSARGTICINSNRREITAHHDILCARRAETGWDAPTPLDSAVNGPSADIAPFIDPAERFLLFASNRAGGAGAFDLYISVNRGGRWQPARTLGPAVNTAGSESNPAVSPDGRRLLFSRNVDGRSRLYEVRFDERWLESEP
jgi:hypothetical protein